MAENNGNFAAAQSSAFPFTQTPTKNGADVDGVLSNNLADIVPLDESLMASDSEGRKSNEDSKFPCEEAERAQNSGFELPSLNEGTRNIEQILMEEEGVLLQSVERALNQMSVLGERRKLIAENNELLKAAVSQMYKLKKIVDDRRGTNNESRDLGIEMIALKTIISTAIEELLPRAPDESDLMQIKEARAQYIAAMASMKSNHSVESIDLAIQAMKRLYALI